MTDTSRLRQIIMDKGLKMSYICERMGITYSTLRRKIDNESEFTASEISALGDLLDMSEQVRTAIFFARKGE